MDKAQIFYTDLIVGTAIFGSAVVLFLVLSNNLQSEDQFSILAADSQSISSSLISAGEPPGWAANNVTKIGLTDGSYRLNTSKVSQLMNISPNTAGTLFGINTNFVVFFKDKHGNVLNINGCAFSSADLTVQNISATLCENFTITPENDLISVERLAVYDAQIIKIVTQVWT